MDFANERYVRLYIRETTTWRLLGWEGQAMLPQVLRMMDRAGVLDLSGRDPYLAVGAHLVGWPTAVVRTGLEAMMREGVVEHRDNSLVWPKYQEAQEGRHTDAKRAREYRLRRARGDSAEMVDSTGSVTTRHDASRVRPSLTSLAMPAVSLRDSAPGGAAGPTEPEANQDPEPGTDRTDTARDAATDGPTEPEPTEPQAPGTQGREPGTDQPKAEATTTSAPAPKRPGRAKRADADKPQKPPGNPEAYRVVEAYRAAFSAASGGRNPAVVPRDWKAVAELLRGGLTADELIAALPAYLRLRGWEADRGWPLHGLGAAWNKLNLRSGKSADIGDRTRFEGVRDDLALLGRKP